MDEFDIEDFVSKMSERDRDLFMYGVPIEAFVKVAEMDKEGYIFAHIDVSDEEKLKKALAMAKGEEYQVEYQIDKRCHDSNEFAWKQYRLKEEPFVSLFKDWSVKK